MTTQDQRPWRGNARAVDRESLSPDSIAPAPLNEGHIEAAGRPPEAAEPPDLIAILTRLANTLDRQARPPVDRLTYRLDELADALGVSRRAIERGSAPADSRPPT